MSEATLMLILMIASSALCVMTFVVGLLMEIALIALLLMFGAMRGDRDHSEYGEDLRRSCCVALATIATRTLRIGGGYG